MDFEGDIFKEQLPNICTASKKKVTKCFTVETVKNTIPIIKWLPKYKLKYAAEDFVAGLTVGLTAIPQAIAYAVIAGLPPQYGLYSAFMGCFVYIFFGTCKDITIGPTAIMSLMVQSHVSGSPDFAILACFLAGCIIFIMGILNLGVLVQFISIPVVTGFTTAAAITIASGQINNMFGISSSSNEFIASWKNLFTNLEKSKLNDSLLAWITLIFLLLMRKIKDLPCGNRLVNKYISLARNAFAVMIGIIICYSISHDGWLPFRVSGEIVPGMPPVKLPPFSTTTTDGERLNFGQMISILGASLASIPLIAILETVAIAKAFAKGKIVDASQEMIAVGLCNVVGSFFSSMPITGSFTRSAINNSSGVRTPLGGLYTGALVLMALALLTKTFYYIPKATLAAIIIAAMIFMIEYERIGEIWRSKKMDLFPFVLTALTCLFWSLEYGILCGVAANLLFILYKSLRPEISIQIEKINNEEICVVSVHENLCYSSAEFLKSKVIKSITAPSNKSIKYVIIKGDEIKDIDSTVAFNIISLQEDLALLSKDLICWNWSIKAAGVVCRLHDNEASIFKFSKTLDELFSKEFSSNEETAITIPIL